VFHPYLVVGPVGEQARADVEELATAFGRVEPASCGHGPQSS
jgi:hypothetical protein